MKILILFINGFDKTSGARYSVHKEILFTYREQKVSVNNPRIKNIKKIEL